MTTFVFALDAFEVSTVVASLRLSPLEAREIAARLVASADEAEKQAKAGGCDKS